MRLEKNFFERDTLKVAEELLGKVLVRAEERSLATGGYSRNGAGEKKLGRIIETEAYVGPEDKACHARHGKTKRNEVMWGPAGHTYIYLCMGLHNLLNIVTEKEGHPAAVLIRKIEPLSPHSQKFKSYGPGNLTKYFGIDRSHSGINISESDMLHIADDGFVVNTSDIESKTRVGIDYAEEYKDKPWRFALKSFN